MLIIEDFFYVPLAIFCAAHPPNSGLWTVRSPRCLRGHFFSPPSLHVRRRSVGVPSLGPPENHYENPPVVSSATYFREGNPFPLSRPNVDVFSFSGPLPRFTPPSPLPSFEGEDFPGTPSVWWVVPRTKARVLV